MKRIQALNSLLIAIAFNTVMATALSLAIGINPLVPILALNIVSLRFGKKEELTNILRVGLNKEIWISDIKEGFYPDTSFLSSAENWDMWVENDKINLAEAGADPDVLINNTSFPIAVADRTDTPISVELDMFDTKNTRLRNAELIELAYDKRNSVINGHKNALLHKFAQKAIHAFAPTSNGIYTPVLNREAENAFKFSDIIDLQLKYNEMDAPDDRILVLSPKHQAALAKEDLSLYKAIMAQKGELLYGFKIFTYSKMPFYTKATGQKLAFGTAVNPANDAVASVAFCASEVMRAVGTVDMFAELKSPTERADIIGFQMRGIALPIRNKTIGAIIQ